MLKNSESYKNIRLNLMRSNVRNEKEKPLSKQALDTQFSKKSKVFIKTIFEAYLQKMTLGIDTKLEHIVIVK